MKIELSRREAAKLLYALLIFSVEHSDVITRDLHDYILEQIQQQTKEN